MAEVTQSTATGPKASRGRAKNFALSREQARDGWLLSALVVLGTLVFNMIPMLWSAWAGFTKWDGVNPPVFNGLENFRLLLQDKLFATTLWNTLYYTILQVPLSLAAGLGLALLVNQKLRFTNFFKAAFFTPVITSTIAIAIVWKWVLANDGLFNQALGWFGIRGPEWLFSEAWAMIAVVLVTVWQSMGYNMVVYLAGLQGVPQQLYEAARIDGANAWHQFWKITLPMLSPVTFFLLIMSFIHSFQVFGLIFVMTQGGPGDSTNVLIYYLYQNAFQFFKMGYASTQALVLFLIIGVITFIQWQLSKRWVHYR